jgi:hypothetical protein
VKQSAVSFASRTRSRRLLDEGNVIHRSSPGNRRKHAGVAAVVKRNRLEFSRRITALAFVLTAVLSVGGCGPDGATGSSGPAADSGVSGVTVAGPQCPVQIAGQPCPPKPISAPVVVQDAAGHQLTSFTSDADGRFHLALPPGNYVLVSGGDPGAPFLKRVQVTVPVGRYVDVQLMFDTGIR